MKWNRPDPVIASAMLASALMIAQMVAAKAVRDSVFLSHFPATSLPAMTIAAAAFAILVSVISSRGLASIAPGRFTPLAFGISAALQVGEWGLLSEMPEPAAVLIFLHVFAINPVLTSWFWSMMNEHFDPSAARKTFGRIAGMGTVGGLLGGLMAERIAALYSANAAILGAAALHLACAVALLRFAKRAGHAVHHADAGPAQRLRVREAFKRSPYLLELAALVVVAATAAALVDYLFKSQAAVSIGRGPSLTRFFALFYTASSLLSFLLQTFAAPAVLSALGLAATVSSLPMFVAAGGGGALIFPSLTGFTLLRGLEVVLRGSMFRSGYELFYTPVPSEEKRAAKPLIDVGGERIGDALGGGIVAVLLALHFAGQSVIVWTAIAFSFAGLILARRLEHAYIAALERSLAKQSSAMKTEEDSDESLNSIIAPSAELQPSAAPDPPAIVHDPLLEDLAALRSGDVGRIMRTLARMQTPAPLLANQLIQLLAQDSVAILVQDRLRRAAPQNAGQLTDTLLNPDADLAVRRRIPSILAAGRSQRAAEGLMAALTDERFEIRFRTARALDYLKEDQAEIRIDSARIWAVVAKELKVSREVWESRNLVAQGGEADETAAAVLESRGEESLECLFVLLGLVLPREPVSTAYRALHTEDRRLRGTALEYLQTVLPANTWKSLEGLLADQAPAAQPASKEEAVARLMASLPNILTQFGKKKSQ